MLRVTFDTNVHISAFTGGHVARELLQLAEAGAFALQLSLPILDEVTEVLERDFGRTRERTDLIRQALSFVSQQVVPHIDLDVVKRDPDDNAVLECSQASRSDYIVTSDKHLLDLKVHDGARIVRPAEFLALLRERGREL